MRGLLLLNLGTPDAPEPEAVGRYLKQFLMDKWVVDSPWPLRWLLVNAMIVPRRRFNSSHAYREIWTEAGSPLLVKTRELAREIEKRAGSEFAIEVGMRYGTPSIEHALKALQARGVSEILVFSLYPQYAESTVRSSQEEVLRVASDLGIAGEIGFVAPFYEHPQFIAALAASMQPYLGSFDHLLLSFHGVPERHVKRTDPSGSHCLQGSDCCARITDANRDCYRAQCFATARALAWRLGLSSEQYTVSFQSRLGRTKWIGPYTDETLKSLGGRGVKRVAVACPSFVIDCLETLEEIRIRGRQTFLAAGGMEYTFIPSLNSDPVWVDAALGIIKITSGAQGRQLV